MDNFDQKRIKGYELRERIGEGGFGAIYRAFQMSIQRDVAIKFILPKYANETEFIRRFETEAHLVASLEHPHIVPLYDYWRDPHGAYLVMRWLRGGTVRDALKNGPISLEDSAKILEQIASALTISHRNRVIHRDLKPENILLDDDGNAYLTDFGIAKVLESEEQLTQENTIVGSFGYLAPEQLSEEEVTFQSDIYSLGFVLYEMLTGYHPFVGNSPTQMALRHLNDPLPDIHEEFPHIPESVNKVIQRATAKKPDQRFVDMMSFAKSFRDALSGEYADKSSVTENFFLDELAIITNPYKGLNAFSEVDASDFYGREALIERFLLRLNEDHEFARFLAVVGPSGSGKSSVVKAGLVPSLRNGAFSGSENWFYADITPGMHPLDELEVALLRIASGYPVDIAEQIRRDERGLVRATQLILPDDNSELVLVVDQFEETFTLVENDDDRKHFLNLLKTAVVDERSRVRIIITLRADFYDRPLLYPGLGDLMQQRTEVVIPLTTEELENAILKPIAPLGIKMDSGIISTIISEVNEQPGALPMLQYALTELFDSRNAQYISRTAYENMGGVLGALASRADKVYNALTSEQKEIARQLFLRLITLGEGTEDIRRRALRSELLSVGGDVMSEVIERFDKSRLLTFDYDPTTREPTVEVAHEAIIREWGQLRAWLEESRADLRLQRVLANAAREWKKSGKDHTYLLHGTRLLQLQEWSQLSSISPTNEELNFLNESISAYEQHQEDERLRQLRERHLEERARQRLQIIIGVMGIAIIIGMFLTSAIFNQSQIATQALNDVETQVSIADIERNNAQEALATSDANSKIAQRRADELQSLFLLDSAQQRLDDDPNLALALIVAANEMESPPLPVKRALDTIVKQVPSKNLLIGHTDVITNLEFSHDGQFLISAAQDKTLRLWNKNTNEMVHDFDGFSQPIDKIAISSDDQELYVMPSNSIDVIIFDVQSGHELRRFLPHTDKISSFATIPNSRNVLSSSCESDGSSNCETGEFILWNSENGEKIRSFEGHTTRILDVAVSPSGKIAISLAVGSELIQWDLETGNILYQSKLPILPIQVEFSADEQFALLRATRDRNVTVWNVEQGQIVNTLDGHTATLVSLDTSPKGQKALGGSLSGTLIIWDIETGEEIRRFQGARGEYEQITFGPDGNSVAYSASDNSIYVADIDENPLELMTIDAHQDEVSAIALSPDDSILASGGGAIWNNPVGGYNTQEVGKDKRLLLWDMNMGTLIRELEGHTEAIQDLVFSSDGTKLLSASNDFTIILWDVMTGEIIHKLTTHTNNVNKVIFGPDDETFVSGAGDNLVIIWDTESGKEIQRFEGHTTPINGLIFSKDGKSIISASVSGFRLGLIAEIIMWDIETGKEIRRFDGHRNWPFDLALSPDGKSLLSAESEVYDMIEWDIETGEEIKRIPEYRNSFDLKYTDDGQYIVSAGERGRINIIDTTAGEIINTITLGYRSIRGIEKNSDGTLLIAASEDGTIKVLDFGAIGFVTLDWVKANRYIRPFTAQECHLYRLSCDD